MMKFEQFTAAAACAIALMGASVQSAKGQASPQSFQATNFLASAVSLLTYPTNGDHKETDTDRNEVMPRTKPKREPLVVKIEEAAFRLGISEQHVRDLIDEGRILAINIGGHSRKFWRIAVGELERFKNERNSLL